MSAPDDYSAAPFPTIRIGNVPARWPEQSSDGGVYIDVFEQSILVQDRPSKSWSFVASVSAELVVVSLAILIPIIQTNHLPDFHWRSVSVGAPVKAPEPAPVARPSSGTRSGPIFPRRVFVFTLSRTPPGNRVDRGEPVSIEAPTPIGLEGPSPGGGIELEKFMTVPAVARPPQPQAPTNRPSGPLQVSKGVQMAKLVKKVIPEYPPLAKAARVSGVVHLLGVIAKDGSIQNLQLISGHPLLARAAMEAVKQWIYQPTLLNGLPVEVISPIDVNFTLGP